MNICTSDSYHKQTAELINTDDKVQLIKISRVKITRINKKVSCKISKLISETSSKWAHRGEKYCFL